MTRVIATISGKGGVGKTTLTTNIGVALAQAGNDVLLIDGNLSGPNMSQHVGIDSHHATLNQVVRGDAYVTQAVARHASGVQVVSASLFSYDLDPRHLRQVALSFLGDKDYILIDSAPGTQGEAEAALQASDEVLLVANPDITSLTNCIGAQRLAERMDREVLGLVLNRVRNESFERSIDEAEHIVGEDVIGTVPESRHVRKALAQGEPLLHVNESSIVSETIRDVAAAVHTGETPERGVTHKVRKYLHSRLLK